MSQFSDEIRWPAQIDNFPWLFNRGETEDVEATILYAEHHNKVRNFIIKAESYLRKDTGEGDGTLKGLTYRYELKASLGPLLASFAYQAWANAGVSQPGNILPFEFIITSSNDSYSAWGAAVGGGGVPYPQLLVQGASSIINNLVYGLNFYSIKPMVSCLVRPSQPVNVLTSASTNWHTDCLMVNSACSLGPSETGGAVDSLIIRGSIIDLSIPADTTNWSTYADNWQARQVDLVMSLFGVQT